MCLMRVLSLGVPHPWLELKRCLKPSSLSFLVLLSSFSVCFLTGKIVIFMVSDFSFNSIFTPKQFSCSLDEKFIFDIEGPWKKKNLADFGIINQCMCPSRVNDQYLTNVMLKINAKVFIVSGDIFGNIVQHVHIGTCL